MSPSPFPAVRQRPSDRVRDYILRQSTRPGPPERLPTMRDLAAHLSVSLATVQSVYRDLKAQGHITTKAGDGTYLVPAGAKVRPASARRKVFFNHIAATMGKQTRMIGFLYGALLQIAMERNLRLEFSALDAEYPEEEQVRTLFEAGELDGMIIFPFIPCQPLIGTCEALGVPYVSIHPPNPTTCANFVTPDYFMGGYRIGEAFAAGKRERIAFLTSGGVMDSSTAWAFAAGLQNALLETTGRVAVEHGRFPGGLPQRQPLYDWFHQRRKQLPDAIFCHRHILFDPLRETLEELKIAVPEEVSLISALDSAPDLSGTQEFTRLALPINEVSGAALEYLQRRMELKGASLPGIKLPVGFAGGQTTLPSENRVLGI